MRTLIWLACACATLACTTLLAEPPTKESVEKLLVVTDIEKLLGTMHQQMDGLMKNAMGQAFQGQELPPEAREFSDRFQQKMMATMKEEMSWAKLKDLYIRVYAETFTQEEVDALLVFYTSPAGKALVTKMPIVMQKSMALMRERMGPIMQNMQKSIDEAVKEVEALRKKN